MTSRLKEDEKNERIIRNLLKLPANRRCINCNRLGPQYVCINFSTFVCTTCSGIHREFTHRVKSVSLAKFTPQEVSAMQGGGNASAREIYLKEWDPQRNSLPDGSNIERLRDFIKHLYVDRRYTGERNLEKPSRAKGENEDFNGNRRADISHVGSQSPPYEETSERRSDRPSLGGRSPGYDQDNRQNSDNKKCSVRAEVVNDWRREDRFGNGRRSDDRSSDGGAKLELRSPDSQSSDVSSPPMIRPVRDILGENVSPLRVIEPPKAASGKPADGSGPTQRTASSSSLASSDGNQPVIKVEASFIDFDSVPEPLVTATVPASTIPSASTGSNNWANFDSAPEVKVNTPASNSAASLLSELSVSISIPGPSASLGKSPPLHTSGLEGSLSGSSFGSSFGSTFESDAPSMALSSGGAPASSIPSQQLPSVAGISVVNTPAPSGGQWPIQREHQDAMFFGASDPPPVSQPVATIGAASSNMPWNPVGGSISHGPPGGAIPMGQATINPVLATSVGLSSEPSLDAKPGGRKELPADLFTMTNSNFPSPAVPGWYSGSPYVAGPHMHYSMPMVVPNLYQVPRSTNPFDFMNERASVQAPTFPTVTSLHGSLPNFPTASGLLRTSSVGTPASLSSSMPAQPPQYASQVPPASFFGQELAGNAPQRPLGPSGFNLLQPAFPVPNPNYQTPAHSTPSSFTAAGGNPFG